MYVLLGNKDVKLHLLLGQSIKPRPLKVAQQAESIWCVSRLYTQMRCNCDTHHQFQDFFFFKKKFSGQSTWSSGCNDKLPLSLWFKVLVSFKNACFYCLKSCSAFIQTLAKVSNTNNENKKKRNGERTSGDAHVHCVGREGLEKTAALGQPWTDKQRRSQLAVT